MKKKRRTRHVSLVFLGILAALFLYGYISSLFLHVEHYSLEANISGQIRIVQLSDLHNAEYGPNSDRLVELVERQRPDLIFLCGDMLNADDSNTEILTALVRNLSQSAPVFFGYGNHEKSWERSFGKDLRAILEEAGATVVDNDYVDLELKGCELRIGGYMGYYQAPHLTSKDPIQQKKESAFFESFQNTDRFKLLINHIPTQWVDWDYVDKYPVDFVFSGHYHGGIIRIPILDRGLYAPYVGWFPPFSKGVFSGSLTTCVLSAGLGTEYHIPRINNPPEIVVVDLIPAGNRY